MAICNSASEPVLNNVRHATQELDTFKQSFTGLAPAQTFRLVQLSCISLSVDHDVFGT